MSADGQPSSSSTAPGQSKRPREAMTSELSSREQKARERKTLQNRKRAKRRKKQKHFKRLRALEKHGNPDASMTLAEPEKDSLEAFSNALDLDQGQFKIMYF